MRKNFKSKIIGLALMIAAFAACDTADQDVSPIVSPDGYPVATFTTDYKGGTLNEGDSIKYTITVDKVLDRSVTFTLNQIGGTVDEDDYTTEPAVLQPYTTKTEFYVVFNNDGEADAGETFEFEVGAYGLADRYLLNPSVVYPKVSGGVADIVLIISFSWDSEDDIDMVTWYDNGGTLVAWGDGGATTDNPETDKSIWLTDPVGTYYVSVMDWGAPDFTYTFTITKLDGSTQTITGTFDSTNHAGYTEDAWTAWGDSYPAYRVLKVVNDGTSLVVSAL